MPFLSGSSVSKSSTEHFLKSCPLPCEADLPEYKACNKVWLVTSSFLHRIGSRITSNMNPIVSILLLLINWVIVIIYDHPLNIFLKLCYVVCKPPSFTWEKVKHLLINYLYVTMQVPIQRWHILNKYCQAKIFSLSNTFIKWIFLALLYFNSALNWPVWKLTY